MKILSKKVVIAVVVGAGIGLSTPAIAHETAETMMIDIGKIVDNNIPYLVKTGKTGICKPLVHTLTEGYVTKLNSILTDRKIDYKFEYRADYNGKGPTYCITYVGKPI